MPGIARKLSGPLLDRMDLLSYLDRECGRSLRSSPLTDSRNARAKVMAARERQARRFAQDPIQVNAAMDARALRLHLRLGEEAQDVLLARQERGALSARAQHRALRVARTIADLDGQWARDARHLARGAGVASSTLAWREGSRCMRNERECYSTFGVRAARASQLAAGTACGASGVQSTEPWGVGRADGTRSMKSSSTRSEAGASRSSTAVIAPSTCPNSTREMACRPSAAITISVRRDCDLRSCPFAPCGSPARSMPWRRALPDR